MPKATDISGTFRVPEEAWGRFWNAMLTIPGAEITPETRVHSPSKREAPMSAKCIVLAVMANKPRKVLTGEYLADLLDEAGKPRGSTPQLLHSLKHQKLIKGGGEGYLITPAGVKYAHTQCRVEGK